MVGTHKMKSVMLLQLAVCGFVVRCAPATTRFESIWHGGNNGCSNPCENIGANICSTQGVCVRDGCGWNCRCYAGYTGKFCEERVFSTARASTTHKKTYDPIVNGNIFDMLDQTLRDSTTSSTTASTTVAETTVISTAASTTTAPPSIAPSTRSSSSVFPPNSSFMSSTVAMIVTSHQSSTPPTTSQPPTALLSAPLSKERSVAVISASALPTAKIDIGLEILPAETVPGLEILPAETVPSASKVASPTKSPTPVPANNISASRKQDQLISKSAEIPKNVSDNNNTKLNLVSPKILGKVVLGVLHPSSVDVVLPFDAVPTVENLLEADPQRSVQTTPGGSTHQPKVSVGLTQELIATDVSQMRQTSDSTHKDHTQVPSSVEVSDDDSNHRDNLKRNDNGGGLNGFVDPNQNFSGEETTVISQMDGNRVNGGNGHSDNGNIEEKGQINNTSNENGHDTIINSVPVVNRSEPIKADNGNEINNINGQNTVRMSTARDSGKNRTSDNGNGEKPGTNDNGNGEKPGTSDNGHGEKLGANDNGISGKNRTSDNGNGEKRGANGVNHKEVFVQTSNPGDNGNKPNGDNGNKQNGDNGSKQNGDNGNKQNGDNGNKTDIGNGNRNNVGDNVSNITDIQRGVSGHVINATKDSNGDNGHSSRGNNHSKVHLSPDNGLGEHLNSSNKSNSDRAIYSGNNLPNNNSDNRNSGIIDGVSSSDNGQSETKTTASRHDSDVASVKSTGQSNNNTQPQANTNSDTKRQIQNNTRNSGGAESQSDNIPAVGDNGSGSSNARSAKTVDNNNGLNSNRHLDNGKRDGGNAHTTGDNSGD